MQMTLHDFVNLATRWSDLGSMVTSQFTDVMENGEDLDDQNANALRMVASVLNDAVANGVEYVWGLLEELNEQLE